MNCTVGTDKNEQNHIQTSSTILNKNYSISPPQRYIFYTQSTQSKALNIKKGGIRLSKTQIAEAVIKIASMLLTVVLAVIKAIGLLGKSAGATA